MDPRANSTHRDTTPNAFRRFVYTRCSLEGRDVSLQYRLEGDVRSVDLCETLKLPFDAGDRSSHPAVLAALRGLHLIGGISYWKAFCPPTVAVENQEIDETDAAYWDEVFTYGLGEFFFRNGISPIDRIHFPSHGSPPSRGVAPRCDQGPLLLVGGGKDSAVSAEVVRHAGGPATLLSVGNPPWIRAAAKASGFRHLVVERAIDPVLFELNAQGALNGHIPISAYIAHATQLVALLGGYDAVITSNERSASFGNVTLDGIEINHQWSKSLRFETLFQSWVDRRIEGAPRYFSLLRPLSELRIARSFAKHPRYFDVVTSCNANFRVDGRGAPERWCGHCPKCVFVYAMLSAVLSEADALRVFGRDLFADERTVPMLEELLGLRAHKPFECVGTPDETLAALWLAHRAGRGASTPGMRFFAERVLPELGDLERLVDEALGVSDESAIPDTWRKALDAYLVDH